MSAGPTTRFFARRKAETTEALSAAVKGETIDLRGMEDGLTEFKLDQAVSDYAARFGCERTLSKLLDLVFEAKRAMR